MGIALVDHGLIAQPGHLRSGDHLTVIHKVSAAETIVEDATDFRQVDVLALVGKRVASHLLMSCRIIHKPVSAGATTSFGIGIQVGPRRSPRS